jgi:hypothetical protein
VHKNEAVKIALRDYARQSRIRVPAGFAVNPAFGPAAIDLTLRVQQRARLRQTGEITPETLLVIGRWLPGKSVGHRAVWAMVAMEGPLEIYGNNAGPYVQSIQRLGSELAPGSWPWCAATVSWALRCAGWKSWSAFVKNEPEAWVPGWVDAARAGKYGMSVAPWYTARNGDAIAFQLDADAHHDHIGFVLARPSLTTGIASTIEGNTSRTNVGSQSDGAGLWRRQREVKPPHVVIRFS